MVNFGEKLKTLRLEKGLTQLALAERLGITKAMVSAYEAAARYPSYDVLIKIVSVFGVTTDYLLGITNKRTLSIDGLSDSNIEVIVRLVDEFKK